MSSGGITLKAYIWKKTLINLAIGTILSTAVAGLATEGKRSGGYMAAFLGAVYLLWAWITYSKIGGGLLTRLKFLQKPEVPYFHRRDKQTRYDDSLAEENQDRLDAILPIPARYRADAIAYLMCGAVLLVLSMIL